MGVITALDVRTGIIECIYGLEESITVVRERHGDRATQMMDPNGRYLLTDAYASLGQLYAALAALDHH